jgi:hypothetical protein
MEHYQYIGVKLSEFAILKAPRRLLAAENAMTSFPA